MVTSQLSSDLGILDDLDFGGVAFRHPSTIFTVQCNSDTACYPRQTPNKTQYLSILVQYVDEIISGVGHEDSTRGVRRQATGVEFVSHVTPAVPSSNTPTPVHDQHDSGLAVGDTQVGVLVLLHKQSQIPGGEEGPSLFVVLYLLSKTSADIPADFLLGIFPV